VKAERKGFICLIFTKEFISKASLLKNLPLPLFAKEGYISSLWQREVRRDFIINVFILMTVLVRMFMKQTVAFTKEFISKATHPHPCPLPSRERGLKNRPSLEGRG